MATAVVGFVSTYCSKHTAHFSFTIGAHLRVDALGAKDTRRLYIDPFTGV
jgi:hypothetical protein